MDAPAPPVTDFLLFRGRPALAAFRHEHLVERARACRPGITDLHGRWIYFARTGDASDRIVRRLEVLLDASFVPNERTAAALDAAIVVTPRPGTISAWSSKATDIARHCALECFARIERGVAWTIAQTGGDQGEAARAIAESGILHDRMTQHAWPPRAFLRATSTPDAGAAALFLDGTPPSHSTVRLGADPHRALEDANASLRLALSPEEIDYLRACYLEFGPGPDRCRADDVRASELRALPPQDLQRVPGPSTASGAGGRCSTWSATRRRAARAMSCPRTATMPPWRAGTRRAGSFRIRTPGGTPPCPGGWRS